MARHRRGFHFLLLAGIVVVSIILFEVAMLANISRRAHRLSGDRVFFGDHNDSYPTLERA